MRLLRMSGRDRASWRWFWNTNRKRLRRCVLADGYQRDNHQKAGAEGGSEYRHGFLR